MFHIKHPVWTNKHAVSLASERIQQFFDALPIRSICNMLIPVFPQNYLDFNEFPYSTQSELPFRVSIHSKLDTPASLWYLDDQDENSWGLGLHALDDYVIPSLFTRAYNGTRRSCGEAPND